MSDDDNYTIDEPDEQPIVASVDDRDEASGHDAVSAGVLVLGLCTIALAAFCATQANFDNTAPTRMMLFVTALTLPLSIVGALLSTVAVCLLLFRLRLPRRGE